MRTLQAVVVAFSLTFAAGVAEARDASRAHEVRARLERSARSSQSQRSGGKARVSSERVYERNKCGSRANGGCGGGENRGSAGEPF